jgi:CBS domain-containing protein
MQIPSKVKHAAEPSVGDVMVREVQTCTPRDTLERAAQLMWEHDCGVLPVVDESHRVVGVVTDRDVCMGAYTRGALLSAIAVGDVMSRRPQTVASDDRLSTAESVIREHRVRRVPVVDPEGYLVGILSLSDLARRAATERSSARRVTPEEVVMTLAAVCEPWSSIHDGADGMGDGHSSDE